MSHDGHAMQGGLPVEEGNVSVHEMPLHNVPHFQLRCQLTPVPILQEPPAPF